MTEVKFVVGTERNTPNIVKPVLPDYHPDFGRKGVVSHDDEEGQEAKAALRRSGHGRVGISRERVGWMRCVEERNTIRYE